MLLSINNVNAVIPASKNSIDSVISPESEHIGIIKAIQFNDTILSSLVIDPFQILFIVSGIPDYSYNYLCSTENMNSGNGSGLTLPCSIIYILDGSTVK